MLGNDVPEELILVVAIGELHDVKVIARRLG